MRDLTARIIGPMAEVSGQLTALYPEEFVYGIAGFLKICAKEPVQSLVEQLKPSAPSYILEHAEWLEPLDEDVFALTTSSGRTFPTRAVIVTAGVGAFEPRRIEAEGAAWLEHRGREYTMGDARA